MEPATSLPLVDTDGAELWHRVERAHTRFDRLLRSVPPDLPLQRSDWKARDVAGHVLTVLRRYTERDLSDPAGLSETATGVADQNRRELAALGAATTPEILDLIRAELGRIRETLDTDLDACYPFHGGAVIDGVAGRANLVGEFLLHGRDVAVAERVTWPLEPLDAALLLELGRQVAASYRSPDATRPLVAEIRSVHTRPWLLVNGPAGLLSRAAFGDERPDLVLRAPAPTLALFLYSRVGLAGAARHGALLVGGRRPWRLPRMSGMFVTP